MYYTHNGTIRYPETNITYQENLNCVWNIQTDARNVLNISFDWINVEKTNNCMFDYVEVRLYK